MYPEAKGVLDLSLADSKPGFEDPVALIVHSVASSLIDRPGQALKDLASPAIGTNFDSQLWNALAYARQHKWAEAREKFKNVEFAVTSLPIELQRIVVAVDPPASSGRRSAACGIVAAGITEDGICYVIADDSVSGLTPNGWAMKAIALWHRFRADALVAEVNQGGEMVRTVINGIDFSVPVTSVHATRGKWVRAEPVAALYEQGRVKHAGIFAALEDEMCDFGVSGLSALAICLASPGKVRAVAGRLPGRNSVQ